MEPRTKWKQHYLVTAALLPAPQGRQGPAGRQGAPNSCRFSLRSTAEKPGSASLPPERRGLRKTESLPGHPSEKKYKETGLHGNEPGVSGRTHLH